MSEPTFPAGRAITGPNETQASYWNGRAGEKWAAMQGRLDRMLSEATETLRATAGDLTGQRVLDVGCGTGETCVHWLEAGAQVTGVDLSSAMLAVAADRTHGRASLFQADATTWTSEAAFDLVVSRLGVMFFSDPEASFANLTRNLRPGGRVLFVCWREFSENDWVRLPFDTIRDLVPEATPPTPHAPGPFALADGVRLAGILSRAGLAEVRLERLDFPVCLSDTGGAAEAADLLTQIGPTGAALAEATAEVRAIAAQRLTAALAPHERGGAVRLGGAVWLVQATRPL